MYLKIDYFTLIAIIGLQFFRQIFFRSKKVPYFILQPFYLPSVPYWELLQTEMTDFPTHIISFTSSAEIVILSYTWSMKKALFRGSVPSRVYSPPLPPSRVGAPGHDT